MLARPQGQTGSGSLCCIVHHGTWLARGRGGGAVEGDGAWAGAIRYSGGAEHEARTVQYELACMAEAGGPCVDPFTACSTQLFKYGVYTQNKRNPVKKTGCFLLPYVLSVLYTILKSISFNGRLASSFYKKPFTTISN
jgi:hypothetical protein